MENLHHFFEIPDLWQFVRWNLYGVLGALLLMWIFRSEIESPIRKKVVSVVMMVTILTFTTSVLFLDFADVYTYCNDAGRLFILATLVLYAADLLRRADIYTFGKDIVLYIGVTYAILSSSLPVVQTAKISYNGQELVFTNILWMMTAIVVVMYSVLSFGLIWSEKRS